LGENPTNIEMCNRPVKNVWQHSLAICINKSGRVDTFFLVMYKLNCLVYPQNPYYKGIIAELLILYEKQI